MIGEIGSPEKLIGKPYEQWTRRTYNFLGRYIGEGNDTPLSRLISRRNTKSKTTRVLAGGGKVIWQSSDNV